MLNQDQTGEHVNNMILFVYGPDTFRSKEKLKEIIAQFREKRDNVGMNVVKLPGEKLEFSKLRQESMTQGFLAEKKMIVIEQLLEHGSQDVHEEVHAFLKDHDSEDNVLVFFETGFVPKKTKKDAATKKLFDLLKKQKFSFPFPELSPHEITGWVKTRVAALGSTIEPAALKEIGTRVGANLWRMAQELHKLSALKHNEAITHEDVATHVDGILEERIFALTDAIAQQNTAQSLLLLSQEKERGAHEMYLLTMIVRQFRIILQIADALSEGITSPAKIAKQLGLHPFVVKKTLPLVQKYNAKQLKEIYARLLNIDRALKSSHPNPHMLLDLLILEEVPA